MREHLCDGITVFGPRPVDQRFPLLLGDFLLLLVTAERYPVLAKEQLSVGQKSTVHSRSKSTQRFQEEQISNVRLSTQERQDKGERVAVLLCGTERTLPCSEKLIEVEPEFMRLVRRDVHRGEIERA